MSTLSVRPGQSLHSDNLLRIVYVLIGTVRGPVHQHMR